MNAPTETVGAGRAGFSGRRLWSLVVVSSAIVLDQSGLAVVNAALPDMGRDLAIPAATLQWAVTGYAVTFGGFLLLAGSAGARSSPSASPCSRPGRWPRRLCGRCGSAPTNAATCSG
ncbi:hypothetical protein [Actinomadura harenae]|uniref:MFS transporter n=1 Tax=Actinomadura harenae TaxID=2483351 RepID=A0A3M2LZ78_9ACTN|nr:hypothetical protein [Actinomadura harenae]RMI42814.1 hypothetical protein EBO15_18420 [Actinomadura harenae]